MTYDANKVYIYICKRKKKKRKDIYGFLAKLFYLESCIWNFKLLFKILLEVITLTMRAKKVGFSKIIISSTEI